MKDHTTSRVQHAPRRTNGLTFAERLAERKARWPQAQREYRPLSDAESRKLQAKGKRSIPATDMIERLGAPNGILERHVQQICRFTLAAFAVDCETMTDTGAALGLIQQHGFPRWLKSQTQPGTIVCGVAALRRRLRLNLTPEVLSEVHAMLYAEIPTVAELQAAQEVCHAGR